MIIFIERDKLPSTEHCFNKCYINDKDGNTWIICNNTSGIYIQDCSNKYDSLNVLEAGGKRLVNTGAIFIKNTDKNYFNSVMGMLRIKTTVFIWNFFTQVFNARFTKSDHINEIETIK